MNKLLLLALIVMLSGCISSGNSIVNANIPIERGNYYYFEITTPKQANIHGNFSVLSDSTNEDGKDIIVTIIRENSYEDWKNGFNVTEFYNSGQVNNGVIDANVPKGDYYVIYSNRYTTFYNKIVKTNVSIVGD